MKVSISVKIIGIVFLLLSILFTVFTFISITTYATSLTESFVERARATVYSFEAGIRSIEDLQDKEKLFSAIYKLMWVEPEIVEISFNVPYDGILITYVSSNNEKIGTTSDRNNFYAYQTGSFVTKIIRVKRTRILKAISPIRSSGRIVGTIEISFTLEEVAKKINSFMITSIVSYAILVSVSGLVLYSFLKRIVITPIMKINEGVKAVTKNSLKYNVKIKTGDELGELSNAFRQMVKDLKRSRTELEKYSKNLEKQVAKRTKELNKKVKELTKTKNALLNMMEDLNELNKKLIESQRALKKSLKERKVLDKEKDRFISITAHELKTPMATILGFARLLKEEDIIKDKEKREKYLSIMNSEIKRLAKLVDDVLDLSRIDLGTLKLSIEETDLKELMKEIKNEMVGQVEEKGLKFRLNLDSNLPKIKTDKEKLKEILINLINNAIKYTEKGSISVSVAKKDNHIEFRVTDTGIGVPKNQYKKIFQRFYQIESPYTRKTKGAGLGLSICKEFVEALGGRIWLKSRVGKGTTFYFTLPLEFKLSK